MEADAPAPASRKALDTAEPATSRSFAAELEAIRKKVVESTNAYEAEKKTVEQLVLDSQQRNAELSSMKRVLRLDAERHEHELHCESEVGKAMLADAKYEVQLMESKVHLLRNQRDECLRLEGENSSLQAELHEITARQIRLGRAHAGCMHDMQVELAHLRQDLEGAFKRALGFKIRHHYETAFDRLELREKEALLQHAQLREEASFQRMGMDALVLRKKIDSEQLATLRSGVKRLRKHQDLRAVEAAKARYRRDNAQSLAHRLMRTFERIEQERRNCIIDSIAMLKSSQFFWFGNDGDLTADEMTDADRASLIQRGLRQLETKIKELTSQAEITEQATQKWERRATLLHRVALDVRSAVSLAWKVNAAHPIQECNGDKESKVRLVEVAAHIMADLDESQSSDQMKYVSGQMSKAVTNIDEETTLPISPLDAGRFDRASSIATAASTIQRILETWEAQDCTVIGQSEEGTARHHSRKKSSLDCMSDQVRKTACVKRRTAFKADRRRRELVHSLQDSLSAKTTALDRVDIHSSTTSLPNLIEKPRPTAHLGAKLTPLPLGAPNSLAAAQQKVIRSLESLSSLSSHHSSSILALM